KISQPADSLKLAVGKNAFRFACQSWARAASSLMAMAVCGWPFAAARDSRNHSDCCKSSNSGRNFATPSATATPVLAGSQPASQTDNLSAVCLRKASASAEQNSLVNAEMFGAAAN